jgi:hypothetical protein
MVKSFMNEKREGKILRNKREVSSNLGNCAMTLPTGTGLSKHHTLLTTKFIGRSPSVR